MVGLPSYSQEKTSVLVVLVLAYSYPYSYSYSSAQVTQMGIDNSLEVDEAIALSQILLLPLPHPYVVELNVDV